MGWDRASTPEQGQRAYELATLYGVVRAAIEARAARTVLGRGLYRGDVAAEARLAIKLDRVESWVRQLDAERARAGSGEDGSEG